VLFFSSFCVFYELLEIDFAYFRNKQESRECLTYKFRLSYLAPAAVAEYTASPLKRIDESRLISLSNFGLGNTNHSGYSLPVLFATNPHQVNQVEFPC
jgi:hypothetical protein